MALDQTKLQLEQARANYATLVGANPGNLAPEPPLPQLPDSIDDAFSLTEKFNPDLAEARDNEVASRQKIASARAATRPTFTMQGSAELTGQGAPFYLYNEDQTFLVQGVLTIPLTSGGQNGAAIARAEAVNSGDVLRIEAARRGVVQNIRNAWNEMTAARRTAQISDEQVKSASVFYEGSFAEYRAGVRSTFDVLYAQETLLNARIQQLTSHHDLYVAQATLLRYIGLLEVHALTTGIGLYDPSRGVHHIENRGATPWDDALRLLDRAGAPGTQNHAITQPPALAGPARIAPVMGPPPPDAFADESPTAPQSGTLDRASN